MLHVNNNVTFFVLAFESLQHLSVKLELTLPLPVFRLHISMFQIELNCIRPPISLMRMHCDFHTR